MSTVMGGILTLIAQDLACLACGAPAMSSRGHDKDSRGVVVMVPYMYKSSRPVRSEHGLHEKLQYKRPSLGLSLHCIQEAML